MSLNIPSCLNIPDDFPGYDKDLFHYPERYSDIIHKILIPNGLIKDRISKIASNIEAHYLKAGVKQLKLLRVLKGGYKFFGDLNESLSNLSSLRREDEEHLTYSVQFIRAKSYTNESSTGVVKITGEEYLEKELRDQDVLVVEDIIDTGTTMTKLLETLRKYNPKSIRVATLVRKRTVRSNCLIPDFVCFEIPDSFIIGYAFDYNDLCRDIPHICTVNQSNVGPYQEQSL
uniref:Hypoxanthine phosphoribosyltransferase n=1 Tax=Lepeophtheirus salmonis TaxID=72036 RepID=C1BUA9_LEPSM|nr:Hypoxanthine-guanine phosphoribosyltransferase [Lepeophtheirus salmonis]